MSRSWGIIPCEVTWLDEIWQHSQDEEENNNNEEDDQQHSNRHPLSLVCNNTHLLLNLSILFDGNRKWKAYHSTCASPSPSSSWRCPSSIRSCPFRARSRRAFYKHQQNTDVCGWGVASFREVFETSTHTCCSSNSLPICDDTFLRTPTDEWMRSNWSSWDSIITWPTHGWSGLSLKHCI